MKPTNITFAFATLCLATLLPFSDTQATTWTIQPDGTGEYPTIQAAVNAASDGDVIELAAGTFTGPGNTDVNTYGLAITIRSASGSATDVTIDCEASSTNPHRGFIIANGEGAGTVIEGVTVTGGYGYPGDIPSAGALLITNSAGPIIRDCVFQDNHAGMTWNHGGGAVYVDHNSYPYFEDCEFRNNSAYFGGAVGINHFSTAEFSNCRFLDNSGGRGGAIWGNSTSKTGCLFARNTADQGGAIWGNGFNDEFSVNCTYTGNSAPEGGGIYAGANYGNPVILIDTIIANSPEGEAIWAASGVELQLSCSDLYGNAGGDWMGSFAPQVDMNGNFSANPCFCAAELDDFQLCADSYCLPGHHPWGCNQLVGAYGQGCADCSCSGPVAIESTTWGSVKGLYR
jgi:hypothetical protein